LNIEVSQKLSIFFLFILTTTLVLHNSIFADGAKCISSSGPFTALYSFLERPRFIPSDFSQSVWSDSVGKWLISKFMEKYIVNNGGRAFFGFDANTRTCGDFTFPGVVGDRSTLSIFFAAKQQLNHPVLGALAANEKHFVLVVRNATHPLYQCAYSAPPPNSSPTPTPTPTRTSSPPPTPSVSVSPTASLSVGASPSTTSSNSIAPSASPTASLSVGASPSTTPSANGGLNGGSSIGGTAGTATNAQGGACFPADATVELLNGQIVSMDRLQIGEKVRVGPKTFSEVFMFTHRLHTGAYDYLRFLLADGRSVLMTPGHFAYINGKKVAARDVLIGDVMDGSQVVEIQVSKNAGLFNPQTLHGDIVVNGVRASTYTEEIAPLVAHPLLTAVRFLHRVTGFRVEMFENGWDGILAPVATA